MAEHNDLGVAGEDLAVAWLQARGFEILQRNWRYRYYEIDIVASRGIMIHFIEVKARHQSSCGHPESSVGRKKFRNLQRAADEYLYQHPGHRWIRYDILAITLFRNRDPEYLLIEDLC